MSSEVEPDHPELVKLLLKVPDLAQIVRRAFEAGKRVGEVTGAEKERVRVQKGMQALLLSSEPKSTRPSVLIDENVAAAIDVADDSDETEKFVHTLHYGFISSSVRSALAKFEHVTLGVSPEELLAFLHQNPSHSSITIEQVRTALKVMARNNQAVRIMRGRYKPVPSVAESLPQQSLPASLNIN